VFAGLTAGSAERSWLGVATRNQLPLLGQTAQSRLALHQPAASRDVGHVMIGHVASGAGSKPPRSAARRRPKQARVAEAVWRRSSATRLPRALTLARQGATIVATEVATEAATEPATEVAVGQNNHASEQGVEADEAEHNGASQLNSSVGWTNG